MKNKKSKLKSNDTIVPPIIIMPPSPIETTPIIQHGCPPQHVPHFINTGGNDCCCRNNNMMYPPWMMNMMMRPQHKQHHKPSPHHSANRPKQHHRPSPHHSAHRSKHHSPEIRSHFPLSTLNRWWHEAGCNSGGGVLAQYRYAPNYVWFTSSDPNEIKRNMRLYHQRAVEQGLGGGKYKTCQPREGGGGERRPPGCNPKRNREGINECCFRHSDTGALECCKQGSNGLFHCQYIKNEHHRGREEHHHHRR